MRSYQDRNLWNLTPYLSTALILNYGAKILSFKVRFFWPSRIGDGRHCSNFCVSLLPGAIGSSSARIFGRVDWQSDRAGAPPSVFHRSCRLGAADSLQAYLAARCRLPTRPRLRAAASQAGLPVVILLGGLVGGGCRGLSLHCSLVLLKEN